MSGGAAGTTGVALVAEADDAIGFFLEAAEADFAEDEGVFEVGFDEEVGGFAAGILNAINKSGSA